MAHSPSPGPCGSDKDCKLDRVCEDGACVWPRPHARPKIRVTSQAPGLASQTSKTTSPVSELSQVMFRLGPQHRGRSPFRIPRDRPQVAWTYETLAPVTASPAITKEGWIIVGSQDRKLYAVDSGGKHVWSVTTGDLVWSSPALASDGTIYFGSDDDHLYAVNGKTGAVRWKLRLGSCSPAVVFGPEVSRCDVDAGPTIGPDGTLYTGGDAIYAINTDGTLRWRFPTLGHVSSSPALMADGTVVAGCQDNSVYAVAKDGSKRWEFRTRDDVESSPAIEEDGTIYIGSDDHRLYALNANGQITWAITTGDDVRASPAIGWDGTVFVGSFDTYFYAIRRDGVVLWSFRTGDRILSSALIDVDGAILVGSQDDLLYALEPDGRLRWSVELGGDVDSSPILAEDGTIYIGSDDKKITALRSP